MHQHAGHLHLARGVEGAHADVGVGEGLGGVVNLAQHLPKAAAGAGTEGSTTSSGGC